MIAFLLLGRLVVGNTMEIGVPFLKSMLARAKNKKRNSKADDDEHEAGGKGHHHAGQWHNDAQAEGLELDGVAEEYLEMMVSCGCIYVIKQCCLHICNYDQC